VLKACKYVRYRDWFFSVQQIITLRIKENENERTNKQTKKVRLNYSVEESSRSIRKKATTCLLLIFSQVWVKFVEKPAVAGTEA
jgi:hypothetical protein